MTLEDLRDNLIERQDWLIYGLLTRPGMYVGSPEAFVLLLMEFLELRAVLTGAFDDLWDKGKSTYDPWRRLGLVQGNQCVFPETVTDDFLKTAKDLALDKG